MRHGSPCPKCRANDIIRIPDEVISNIGLGNRIATRWRAVRVTRYLCGSCGYLEEWADDPKSVERIRAKYGS
jgi:Zn ribbon nucleic-acid-binding protein